MTLGSRSTSGDKQREFAGVEIDIVSPRPRRPSVPAKVKGPRLEVLTEREHEVLAEVARGLSTAEIAETLHMSLATAKIHASRILTELNARDRAQLVVIAYETGLATLA